MTPFRRRHARPPTAAAPTRRALLPGLGLVALLVTTPGAAAQVPGAAPPAAEPADTAAEPGRFDFGKMWTFEYPPAEYFSTTYGFDADEEWFERARLAALRIPGCSASFVSPSGLVVTNHHCARSAIARVTGPGESLLDDGFYATSSDEERPIPDYWADQLVHVEDVTGEVDAAVAGTPPAGRAAARAEAFDAVRARLEAEHGGEDPVLVQVVSLYNGGRTSAYVFRRFTDVRLVAAVELDLGFFGGDPDNFTYPRYALDYAFYRIYDDGRPWEPEHWFTWGDGAAPGDPVFVIGNPGPTNRLQSVAQLEYQRDVTVPIRKTYFETRLAALRDAYASDPGAGERLGLRNQAFSLSNSLKAYTGRLDALRDEQIMARKRAAEAELVEAVQADPSLRDDFGAVLDELAALQDELRALAPEQGAFYRIGDPTYGSRALVRAFGELQVRAARERGASPAAVDSVRAPRLALEDHPADLEEDLLALRLADLSRYLGDDDPVVAGTLEGRSPEGAATALLGQSVLGSQASYRAAVSGEGVPADDPLLALAGALLLRYARYQGAVQGLGTTESELAADLGRARFAVYGTYVPPDATSSPRITDGVVRSYEYNGTLAPTHTTLFGMYDRYYAHQDDVEWQLTDPWLPVPDDLDLSTPLNFISTADTYGGNSGSPAVTRDLALVGLNFDRNIQGLSRDFIYLPERGRNIMVDVRAIRESLDVVYDADRIVLEITTGQFVRTESEADAILGDANPGRGGGR